MTCEDVSEGQMRETSVIDIISQKISAPVHESSPTPDESRPSPLSAAAEELLDNRHVMSYQHPSQPISQSVESVQIDEEKS